jgi:V/A-type H+-transporting ATPase subunit B
MPLTPDESWYRTWKDKGGPPECRDQLYASYAYGRDLRRLVAIVGEEALTELDKRYLKFADEFERHFITQGDENRSIERTLEIAWQLFTLLPEEELKRIKREFIQRYHPAAQKGM